MKHNTWKMIAIVLMAVVGALIIFAIVPGLVVLVTTPHIINVDTNSQWIGFWGNYLGAIVGGVLGIAGAVFVLRETIKDNVRERERSEVLAFCDYLIRKSSDYEQKCSTFLYSVVQYKNIHASEKFPADVKMQLLNEVLEIHHGGKISLYEILKNLNIRDAVEIYQTSQLNNVKKACEELYECFDQLEEKLNDIKDNDKIWIEENTQILDRLDKFANILDAYEKELFIKVTQ